MDAQNDMGGEETIAKVLRGAVDDEQFDYSALVAGTHQRAGRIRRRRAIVTGAAAAVLAPALAGGAALVLPDLLPGNEVTVIAPAGPSDEAPSDGAAATSAPVDESATTAAPDVPPWQDSEPPLEGRFEVNEDLPNAWEIPDARPTGVDFLDSLGAPQLAMNYPRTVPVMGLMACDPGRPGGVEPEAGQSFGFFDETSARTVDIEVTGWADSRAAFDGLANDTYTLCTWDDVDREQVTWDSAAGADQLLYAVPGEESSTAAAIIRQGDYVVAVTVSGRSGEETTAVAAEIAEKTAANLEALDPAHGRD